MEQDSKEHGTLTPDRYTQAVPPVQPSYSRRSVRWVARIAAVVVLVGIGLLVRDSLTFDAGDAEPSSFAYRVGYQDGWLADISPSDNVYTQLPRSEWAATADERIDDGVKALAQDCDSQYEGWSDVDYTAGRELALQDKAAGREKRVFTARAEGAPTRAWSGYDCD